MGLSSPRIRRATVPRSCARESRPKFLLVAYSLHALGHPERYREPGQTFELLVRTPDQNVEPRDHLRHHAVFDSCERLPTEVIEDEIGPVAEVEELEVIVEHPIESLEQAIVGEKQQMARAEAATLEDDDLVLELAQVRHLEPSEVARGRFDLLHPALVELVPVCVVVAAAPLEQLAPLGKSRFVSDRVGTVVDVSAEDSVFGAERGRHGEHASARLVESSGRESTTTASNGKRGSAAWSPFWNQKRLSSNARRSSQKRT